MLWYMKAFQYFSFRCVFSIEFGLLIGYAKAGKLPELLKDHARSSLEIHHLLWRRDTSFNENNSTSSSSEDASDIANLTTNPTPPISRSELNETDTSPQNFSSEREVFQYANEILNGTAISAPPHHAPNSLTFKILEKSVEIALKLIPFNLIAHIHLKEVLWAFTHLFHNIDVQGRDGVDKNFEIDDFNSLMLVLDLCCDRVTPLPMKIRGNPPQIKLIFLRGTRGYEELEPQITESARHNLDSEDYIVGAMWKIVEIIYATCLQDFVSINPVTQFDYVVTMDTLFRNSAVQQRWFQPQFWTNETKQKLLLVSHPDIKIFTETLDKIDAGMHAVANLPGFLRKPKTLHAQINGQADVGKWRR